MAGCGELDCSVTASAPSKQMEEVGDSAEPSGSTAMNPECSICLQSCIHPVRLPCLHVFCFLCVKGASWQSKRCALCRQEVPEDFLERPVLLSPEELKAAASGASRSGASGSDSDSLGDHAWYYEGRNGWWQYDERTNRELEEAFAKDRKSTEMLIAGFLYVADLENMVQYRRNEHGRRRKIKRDVVDIPKKGVAGLRLDPEPVPVLSVPVVTPAATERVSSADGSDTGSGQPQSSFFGIMASLPPVRPPTLLGRQPTRPLPPSPSSVEESFSQLLISQPGCEEVEGDDELQTYECASGSSDSEEERECERGGAASIPRLGQRPLRERQPARMPPGGGPSSAAVSLRSRSPDGQCTVTEV